jgi:S-adenosylmethionine synthetase
VGRHGGGAFSGKDPTKVDRSAALAARWVAKTVVAAGLASRCEAQLAYAIGVSRPVSVRVDTFGTGRFPEDRIESAVLEIFDLSPRGMIEALDLRRPIYLGLARDGHFGLEGGGRTWESTDRKDALRDAVEGRARRPAASPARPAAKAERRPARSRAAARPRKAAARR